MSKKSFIDTSALERGLEAFMGKAEASIQMYAETAALKLQNHMRDEAPWTDRTGDARKRLTGTMVRVREGYQIILSHGVNYGIWLELAHEKRFAIIQPTILVKSDEVIRGLDRLLERLK